MSVCGCTVGAADVVDVHGSVHRKYIPIYIQQNATLHILMFI